MFYHSGSKLQTFNQDKKKFLYFSAFMMKTIVEFISEPLIFDIYYTTLIITDLSMTVVVSLVFLFPHLTNYFCDDGCSTCSIRPTLNLSLFIKIVIIK